MSNPLFFRFLNETTVPRGKANYNGYLSFIPDVYGDNPDNTLAHRYLANQDFFWLEMKDSVTNATAKLEIETQEDCLWIYIDLLGQSLVLLSKPQSLSSGEILCYWTSLNPYQVRLENGKNWLLMIGITPKHFADIVAEYPLLRQLHTVQNLQEINEILGKMTTNSKLYGVLDALKRITFRPFGTYYLLMAWNLRIFDIIFNESKVSDTNEQSHDVKLYYGTLAYLRQHFCEEGLSLNSIAQAMNVSVSTLTRSFANRPHSVSAYLQELRLVEARDRIMASDNTIVSIAFSLHFVCQKSFSKLFKKRFGYTPTEWREKMIRKRSLVN
ncbi:MULTISPECIES: helix-turn-helix transcriptional regulator [Sphingobacterium]|uniref:helix-turn-helix transcriptional regulator n=1 Tax=Sphingobacterium TaxID=28453 RepID=UPI0013D8EFD4|nr:MULTISPECIES: helix-turn-helix transcriptional regulator [unclassified Sphingobacterium]